MCSLKGTSDADSYAVLSAWLEESPLNKDVYNELVVLWETVRQESAEYDADLAWARVRELAAMEDLHSPVRARKKSRFGRLSAAVACVFASVAFLAVGYRAASVRHADYLSIEQCTPFNGKSQFHLSDGTDVILRNGSTISLKESQSSGRREVCLDGEAYFHVARNDGRPFLVKVDGMEICVHGTEFNVRELKSSGDILVSLQKGSVSLKAGDKSLMMKPGEIVRCSADGSMTRVHGDVLQENCWTKNSLEFKGWTLSDVCGCLSRWYDVKISVAPEIAGLYKYNFTVRNESLDEILSMMALASHMGYTFRLDGSVQIYKK